jgi:hypothetical protein
VVRVEKYFVGLEAIDPLPHEDIQKKSRNQEVLLGENHDIDNTR